MGIIFNSQKLGTPENKYVLWVDIMGIKEKMSRSLWQSANFICKFHSVVSESITDGVTVYPVMDGVYVTFDDGVDVVAKIKKFISNVFSKLLLEFSAEKEFEHRFMVRGGLAYGPIYAGSRLTKDVVPQFYDKGEGLLLGFPVVQANVCEGYAPPFGICLHDSVLAKASEAGSHVAFSGKWYHWEKELSKEILQSFKKMMSSHYRDCENHKSEIGYKEDSLKKHQDWANEFWELYKKGKDGK